MIPMGLINRSLVGSRKVGGTWGAIGTWILPAFTLGGNITATGKEIDAAILDACVGKGTWTTSGIWTIPAVTLGGAMTLNGRVFDAGTGSAQVNTTGSLKGILIQSTNDGNLGATFETYHVSASPAAGDYVSLQEYYGKNSAAEKITYGEFVCIVQDPVDAQEDSQYQWTLMNAGATNLGMTLSGAGLLSVDAAGTGAGSPSLFDDYDDAMLIKQGIQENNRELLADMGVLDRKNTGSGYMMNIQPMIRLLAGGIYQTRQMLEDIRDELTNKVVQLENKLMLLEAG